jgi:O-antigen/teichoic acid export membrane protein
MASIRPLVRFGIRAASANIFEQLFKNIDYLLIGWFYGASQLAVYRVAFDVAMEPAQAVGTLVNRTALPVLARVAAVRDHLVQSLSWSLTRLATLVVPLMVGLILVADPLTALLHDEQGSSYAAAALPLKILAAAALLRVSTQLLTPLMLATGRPGTALRLAAATLILLSGGIAVVGVTFDARSGIVAVSAVWLAVYPLLLIWGSVYLKRHWNIGVGELAPAFIAPLVGGGLMVALVKAAQSLTGGSAPVQVGIVVVATALTYGGLFLNGRRQAQPA